MNGLANEFIFQAIETRETARKEKEKIRRRTTAGLITGIVIALVLAGFAAYQMVQAQKQAAVSRSQALASQSQLQRLTKNGLGLLLALESFQAVRNLSDSEKLVYLNRL